VTILKSLWASVQGDPTLMRRVNGWFTIFWIAMIPLSIILGLLSSVAYVSALSLWALVSGHWSAWQAARVEVAQSVETQKLEENPIEERVVEQLIRETDVQPAQGNAAGAGAITPTSSGNTDLRRRIDDLATHIADLQNHLESHPPTEVNREKS
jgi:hypothetical protein